MRNSTDRLQPLRVFVQYTNISYNMGIPNPFADCESSGSESNDQSDAQSTSFSEPPVCFDTDCSYPYGPACQRCIFALDLREQERSKISCGDRREWVEKIDVQTHITEHEAQVSVGCTDEQEEELKLTSEEEKDDEEENLKLRGNGEQPTSPEQVPPSPPSNPEATLSSLSRTSFYSLVSSLTPPAHFTISARLEHWLSELFSNTLEQHVENNNFIGGAEDSNPTASNCPYCFKPLGDPRDQHLLRCRYAHEERSRLDRSIMRGIGNESSHARP